MENLLFINAFFEEEILGSSNSITNYLFKHSIYLQLHYLSCILAEERTSALLLFPPEEGYFERLAKLGLTAPNVIYLQDPLKKQYNVSSWGPSLLLEKWAKEKNCFYKIPSFDLVKQVNGKDFSFALGDPLPFAKLLETEEEVLSWVRAVKGPKVLKTLYGSSGRGHLILYKEDEEKKALEFFQREKERSCCFVAEPWVERVLDFSSQWEVSLDGVISYLGATVCENSPRGIYRRSLVGPVGMLFREHKEFLQEHLEFAKKALEQMRGLGFFGPVGFDAMLYKDPKTGKNKLQPILEINARRTMGWAALKLYEKLNYEGIAFFSYELKKTGKMSYLPHYASEEKKLISLPGQLVMDLL